MGSGRKIAAVVQARMGSQRLPGKMLMHLGGMPLVDHVLSRLHGICGHDKVLDSLVLATSEHERDDQLAVHVKSKWPGVVLVRGSETDVLSRFLAALDLCEAETLVRVTGDCPFVNVAAIAQMIESHEATGADITNYAPGYEYVDKGVEVVRADALRRAARDPRLSNRDREHVTAFLYGKAGKFRVNYVESEAYLRRGDIRLTVDTQEDLDFCEALIGGLGGNSSSIGLRQVTDYVDAHPEIVGINAGAGRKSTLHEKMRLGFRCDGGTSLGLGHVVGCVRLARIAASLGCGVEFVLRVDSPSVGTIRRAGFAVETLPHGTSPRQDIDRLIEKAHESDWTGVVVNFCKDDLERYAEMFSLIKDSGTRLIFMDNPLPSSVGVADLAINALPHPDYDGYDPASLPACFDGLDYFLSGADAGESVEPRVVRPIVERILVAMGGGDEWNATGFVLKVLAELKFAGFVDVVLGAANPNAVSVREQFATSLLNGEVSQGASDLPARMRAADMAFSGLGLTTYEMALYGLPVLLIAGNEVNATVSRLYEERYGGSRFLGALVDLNVTTVAREVAALVGDLGVRCRMAAAQHRAVDGCGEQRVVEVLRRFLRIGSREEGNGDFKRSL